jgi:alcohol dehydrogenase
MEMRAAVLHEQGRSKPYAKSMPITVEKLDIEGPREGEVLIEMVAAGLCHSDLSTIEGQRPRKLPTVLGHEGGGIVRDIGPGVRELGIGDHVVLGPVLGCGECRDCLSGHPALCTASLVAKSQGTMLDGTSRLSWNGENIFHTSGVSCFAEFSVASEFSVVAIDPELPLTEAALFGCAVMTGVGSVVNTAEVSAGAVVAVVGLGGVGLSAILGAVLVGAKRIIAVDVHDEKLSLASEIGATHSFRASDPDCIESIRELTGGGVDFAFEMSGVTQGMKTAYDLVRRGGTMVTASLPTITDEFSVNAYDLVSGEKSVRGCYMGSCVPSRDIPRFLRLYKRGRLPIKRLMSALITLDDINIGYDRLADGKVARQVIEFSHV